MYYWVYTNNQFDAVRTSILSSKWRYTWMKLPQFSLDANMWDPLVVKDASRSKVTMILWQLMLNHEGPVLKFTLSIPGFDSCSIIDNLILFLSRNNIEDLKLQMWEDHYSLPASIFKCQLLRHLNLEACSLSNTRALKGFSRLTTLLLTDIVISDEALRRLISESPLLESLELRTTRNLDIYIDAANLRRFYFEGFAKSMSLQLMPLVDSVSIKLVHIGAEPSKECSLTQFFQAMPAIEYLYLDYGMIKKFYMKETTLCTTLVHLQYLDLYLMSFDEMEFQFILCLLRSFPNLKCVETDIQVFSPFHSNGTLSNVTGEDYSGIWLSQLENVKLRGVNGSSTELEFIKLSLAKSPILKRIEIVPGTVAGNGHTILKKAIEFQRLSKEAQIIYKG